HAWSVAGTRRRVLEKCDSAGAQSLHAGDRGCPRDSWRHAMNCHVPVTATSRATGDQEESETFCLKIRFPSLLNSVAPHASFILALRLEPTLPRITRVATITRVLQLEASCRNR